VKTKCTEIFVEAGVDKSNERMLLLSNSFLKKALTTA
jgi:hypothetical protein